MRDFFVMKDYKELQSKKVTYKGNECYVINVPSNVFNKFIIHPIQPNCDIGSGAGSSILISVNEFELECDYEGKENNISFDISMALFFMGIPVTQDKLNEVKRLISKHKWDKDLTGLILRYTDWVEKIAVNGKSSQTKNDLLKLSKEDLWYLADICWYIKGFVAAQKENYDNEFGQHHIDVLTKVINECKSE